MTVNENEIRRTERERLSDLIRDEAETIAAFAADKESAVRLVAHLIRHHAKALHDPMTEDYARQHRI